MLHQRQFASLYLFFCVCCAPAECLPHKWHVRTFGKIGRKKDKNRPVPIFGRSTGASLIYMCKCICICIYIYIYIRGGTVHVFVPNRHGKDLSVRCMRPYDEYRQFTPNPEGGARSNATLFDKRQRQQKNSEYHELRAWDSDHVLITRLSHGLTKVSYFSHSAQIQIFHNISMFAM